MYLGLIYHKGQEQKPYSRTEIFSVQIEYVAAEPAAAEAHIFLRFTIFSKIVIWLILDDPSSLSVSRSILKDDSLFHGIDQPSIAH